MKGARDWAKLHLEQKASGLSISEFCKRRGMSPSGLYNYVSRRSPKENLEPKFVEAVVSDRGSVLEIHGPGWSVRIPTHLPTAELTRIMRAVTEVL